MSAPTVAFRDAETAVIAYLDPLVTEPVSTRVPAPRPAAFFRLFRVGGPRETRVTDAARITVEAWAATEHAAALMLNTARSFLLDAETDGLFGVQEYGGPINLPDPTTDSVRYTASYVIRVRTIN